MDTEKPKKRKSKSIQKKPPKKPAVKQTQKQKQSVVVNIGDIKKRAVASIKKKPVVAPPQRILAQQSPFAQMIYPVQIQPQTNPLGDVSRQLKNLQNKSTSTTGNLMSVAPNNQPIGQEAEQDFKRKELRRKQWIKSQLEDMLGKRVDIDVETKKIVASKVNKMAKEVIDELDTIDERDDYELERDESVSEAIDKILDITLLVSKKPPPQAVRFTDEERAEKLMVGQTGRGRRTKQELSEAKMFGEEDTNKDVMTTLKILKAKLPKAEADNDKFLVKVLKRNIKEYEKALEAGVSTETELQRMRLGTSITMKEPEIATATKVMEKPVMVENMLSKPIEAEAINPLTGLTMKEIFTIARPLTQKEIDYGMTGELESVGEKRRAKLTKSSTPAGLTNEYEMFLVDTEEDEREDEREKIQERQRESLRLAFEKANPPMRFSLPYEEQVKEAEKLFYAGAEERPKDMTFY